MRCFCVMRHGQPLELVHQDVPQPKGTEVLVRVKAAGMCHSDLHLWEGYYDLGGGKKLPLADRGLKLPLTMSHEICDEENLCTVKQQALGLRRPSSQRTARVPWAGSYSI
jgi:propanol-preferring alcohol dehydrogenase